MSGLFSSTARASVTSSAGLTRVLNVTGRAGLSSRAGTCAVPVGQLGAVGLQRMAGYAWGPGYLKALLFSGSLAAATCCRPRRHCPPRRPRASQRRKPTSYVSPMEDTVLFSGVRLWSALAPGAEMGLDRPREGARAVAGAATDAGNGA